MIAKYHVKAGIGSRDGGPPHKEGDIITADDLPQNCDLAWLLRCKALVPFGKHSPAESLLTMSNPTPDQFRDEVARLQQIVEDQQQELDAVSSGGFKSAATAGTAATPVPTQADNATRKLLEVERRECLRLKEANSHMQDAHKLLIDQSAAERTRAADREMTMGKRITELESEVAHLTAEIDQLTAPVT